MAEATGWVVQVLGGVVDVEFPRESLPDIYDAVEFEIEFYKLSEGDVRSVADSFIRPFDLSRAPLIRV